MGGAALLALAAGVACGGGDDETEAAPTEAAGSSLSSVDASPSAAATSATTMATSTSVAEGTPTVSSTVEVTPETTPAVAPTVAAVAAEPTAVPVAPAPTQAPAAPPPAAAPSTGGPAVARMSIPSLGVNHPIEQLGTTRGGAQLDTPRNETGAIGWYAIDAIPDFAVPGAGGNAFFSAHINYNGVDGPFASLANISSGATINVTLANGAVLSYQVFAIRGYVTNAAYETASRPMINMDDLVFTPNKPPGEEWITLMTCSCGPGRIVNQNAQGFGDCVDRDVVIARLVS